MDPDDLNFVSFAAGPLTLAAECDPDDVFTFERDERGRVINRAAEAKDCIYARGFTSGDGKDFVLKDYASLGRDWTTPVAAWLRTAPAPESHE